VSERVAEFYFIKNGQYSQFQLLWLLFAVYEVDTATTSVVGFKIINFLDEFS